MDQEFKITGFFFFLFTAKEKYLKCGEEYLYIVTVELFTLIIEEKSKFNLMVKQSTC